MTRGERALVGVPKLVAEPKAVSLVCIMTAVQTLVVEQGTPVPPGLT